MNDYGPLSSGGLAPGIRRWFWAVPLLLIIIVYAPAFWGDLVWDDLIIAGQQLGNFKTVGDAFEPPAQRATGPRYYYRPVITLSYMLDRKLFGSGATVGPHVANVIYHLITTFFVWLLARRLLRHLPNAASGSILAATIFAIHPIHTESVSWVAGRSDTLSALFLIPSVILALYWRDRGSVWYLALGALTFFLALLAKEVAVAGLMLIPAAMILTTRDGDHRNGAGHRSEALKNSPAQKYRKPFLDRLLVWIGAGGAYIGATAFYLSLRSTAGGMNVGAPSLGWMQQLEMLVEATAFYLIKVCIPWLQSNVITWEMTPGLPASIIIALSGIGVGLFGIRQWLRHDDGVLLMAMLWFAAPLAPALFIALSSLSWTPLAERYLYLPSVGMALLTGMVFCRALATPWRRHAIWAVALLTIVYAISTVERGFVWQTNLKLWSDATKRAGDRALPWHQLGTAYMRLNESDHALAALFRALDGKDIAKTHVKTHANIGRIYLQRGNLEAAEQYFRNSLDEDPTSHKAHWLLAMVYKAMAEQIQIDNGPEDDRDELIDKAIGFYTSALRQGQKLPLARWELSVLRVQYGDLLLAEGERTRANAQYRAALAELNTLLARNPEERDQPDVMMLRDNLTRKFSLPGL